MTTLEQLNAFYENLLSVEECRKLLQEYAETIDGFVIFGANQIGISLKRQLQEMSFNVVCFLDEFTEFDNVDNAVVLHSIEEVKKSYPQVCFIISANVRTHRMIMIEKLNHSFYKCDVLNEEVVTYCQCNSLSIENSSTYIHMLCLLVTNRCTLKCRGCSSGVSTIPAELKKDFPIAQMKKAIENLGKITAGSYICTLTGGEPLLHPELAEIIYCIRENMNVGQLYLVTNGTLIPSKEVLKAMAECHVFVRISDYESLSSKKEELIALLESWNINVFSKPAKEFPWTEYEETYNRMGDGQLQMEHCRNYQVYNLYNGKLYPCCVMIRQHERQLYKPRPDEYIDLIDDMNLDMARKTLKELYQKKTPFYGCQFCSMNRKTIEPAVQLK